MEKKYYIYLYLDDTKPGEYIYEDLKFEYEPFYVGKGSLDRINNSIYDKGTFKSNKIRSIKNKGGKVIRLKLYENLYNHESLELEKLMISKIGRRDLNNGPLTNLTNGGDGRLISPHTEETKRKISETKKSQNLHTIVTDAQKEHLREINLGEKNPMYGKTHSNEIKKAQSFRVSGKKHPMYGKKHSEETLSKIRENRNKNVDQKKKNIENRLKHNKCILQYDLNGDFIREFESIKIASKELGLSESLIGKTCRGIVKNPRKFLFSFKEPKDKIFINSYLIKEGETYNNMILIKRFKYCVAVTINGEEKTLSKYEYPEFWDKKSN